MEAPLSDYRPFVYRPTRTPSLFRVQFVAANNSTDGLCRNISQSGLRAQMDAFIPPGTIGRLLLYRERIPFELAAEITYIDGDEVAFLFHNPSLDDQERLTSYLQF